MQSPAATVQDQTQPQTPGIPPVLTSSALSKPSSVPRYTVVTMEPAACGSSPGEGGSSGLGSGAKLNSKLLQDAHGGVSVTVSSDRPSLRRMKPFLRTEYVLLLLLLILGYWNLLARIESLERRPCVCQDSQHTKSNMQLPADQRNTNDKPPPPATPNDPEVNPGPTFNAMRIEHTNEHEAFVADVSRSNETQEMARMRTGALALRQSNSTMSRTKRSGGKSRSLPDEIKNYINGYVQDKWKFAVNKFEGDDISYFTWRKESSKFGPPTKHQHLPCEPEVDSTGLVKNFKPNCSVAFFKRVDKAPEMISFDNLTGYFQASVPGLYLIHVTIFLGDETRTKSAGIFVNDQLMMRCPQGGLVCKDCHSPKRDRLCAVTGVLQLKTEEKFALKPVGEAIDFRLQKDEPVTLTAVLLQSDEPPSIFYRKPEGDR